MERPPGFIGARFLRAFRPVIQMLEITGAIRKAKEGAAFGGLPTRQTCQLAGPSVYEPASHPASAATVCQW